MKELEGRVAIVTGAAQGIGEATALQLAEKGAAVAVVDLNEAGAKDTVEQIEALGSKGIALKTDLTNGDDMKSSVEQTVSAFGRLDILVNNASNIGALMSRDLDVVNTDLEIWDRSYEVNLRATAAMCKFAIPHMIEAGSGSIVNISSMQGLIGDLERTAYSAVKAGVILLSKSVATQYGAQGVRCNTVCPGLVYSPTASAQDNVFLKTVEESMLLSYKGMPSDLANLIVFLASDKAAYITGQTIGADGGMGCHMPFYAQMRAIMEEQA